MPAFRSLVFFFVFGQSLACASAATTYAPRCSLRDPAVVETMESRISRLRSDRSLKPLAWDPALRRAAQEQSNYLALTGSVDHADREGGGPLRRLRAAGISRRVVGENIARVEHESSPALTTIRYWTGRKVELANLLNPDFQRMGLGVTGSEKHCFTVLILSD